jgi:hypothetical protein
VLGVAEELAGVVLAAAGATPLTLLEEEDEDVRRIGEEEREDEEGVGLASTPDTLYDSQGPSSWGHEEREAKMAEKKVQGR